MKLFSIQEPEPYDTAAIAENILIESENKVKAEEELGVPGSSSKKFVTVTDYAAIVMDNHGFDKDHYCVMAEVSVIITATKPMDIPVNYSQLLNDIIELDIYKMLLSFPRRPGDLLCWCVNFAMVNVFVLQLMCVLLQSQVYSEMNTAAYKKFCMKVELLHFKLSLSCLCRCSIPST